MTEALRKRADQLGVAYTLSTSGVDLQRMVDARERGDRAPSMATRPECFGVLWDPPADESCRDCGAEAHCAAHFAVTLGGLVKARGGQFDEAALANEVDVSEEAVRVAWRRFTGVPAPKPQLSTREEASSKSPSKSKPPAKPLPKSKAKPKRKTKRKAKARPKAKPLRIDAKIVDVPLPDLSGGVSVRPGRKGSAVEIERLKDLPPGTPKGDRGKLMERWKRERERSAVIAEQVTPGTILRRDYKGVRHEVVCRLGYYQYHGREYPTLYAVTRAIVGTKEYSRGDRKGQTRKSPTWSATRFWKLKPSR